MCRIYGCMAAVMCLCLAGCSDGGPDLNLVPVVGTVTLDGQPLANKSLLFTPESGGGVSAGGNTDASGKYSLTAVVSGVTGDQAGAPPGQYKVTVFEPMIAIESAEGDEMMEEMIIPGQSQSTIPLIYQAVATTDLVVTVPDAGGTIDIKLSSGG